jgi:exopolysaccharide biosynthesis polyprenyl glycosylphosphotransferase
MLLRLPWLLSRKRLLASVVIDSVLFSLLYTAAFLFRFGRWPGLSLPVGYIDAFWVLSSYVFGRYHLAASAHVAQFLNYALRSCIAFLLSSGVCLAYFWLSAGMFGTIFPMESWLLLLLVLTLLSTVAQFYFGRILLIRDQQSQCWLFLGDSQVQLVLEKHLALRRLTAHLEPIVDQEFSSLKSGTYSGVLCADFNAVPAAQQQQLLQLQHSGLPVLSLVGWCERVLQRFPSELLTPVDLLRGDFSFTRGTMQLRLKRFGDLLVSCGLLLLTAPILLIAGLLIRLNDGGPVLYSQQRSGLDRKRFRIWKLRTMCVDAEQHGAQWAVKGDARITPLGRLLRITRLDELPQLWAVLHGDMSLIGPRPERPEFEQELERQIPYYHLRHLMRPGLSGWAQVNYPYGASVEDAANKLSYDLYYMRNFSCWLDLLILFKTIRLVFNAQGAVPSTQSGTAP